MPLASLAGCAFEYSVADLRQGLSGFSECPGVRVAVCGRDWRCDLAAFAALQYRTSNGLSSGAVRGYLEYRSGRRHNFDSRWGGQWQRTFGFSVLCGFSAPACISFCWNLGGFSDLES